MMILKEFSRIVCVSLFSYQGSFVLLSCDSSSRLSHSSALVKYFFHFLSEAFMMFARRSQATCLLYHIFISLSTTFSHFSKLLKLFKLFIQKKQFFVTAQLEYHYKTNMSTPFFDFFIIFINILLNFI